MEAAEGGGQDELGFATRVKALAIADPVLDLERRKRALDRDWLGYQMEELALAAIDSVTLRMDFEEGVRFSDAAADVIRVAAAQMPSRGPAEHADVASWVLNSLINVGTVDRNFRHPYGMITDGRYRKHDFDFKILREVPGPDGEPRLRAETAAIAVLVGAVEVDIASEQVAAEAKLAALVKRGRLADAHRAAQAALRRTVQYGESLRYFLETAQRDVRAVDWGRDVGGMQREALDHIEERIHAENAIRDNLLQIVDDATDDVGRRKQATGLVGILDECLKRHMALQAALQRAGSVFREEQARQTFIAPPSRQRVDLFAQLLSPALGLSAPTAEEPLAGFFAEVRGPALPPVAYLPDLTGRLLQLPAEHEAAEELIEEPDLDDDDDAPRFAPAQYEAAERILGGVPSKGTRLSSLLTAAREPGPGTGPDADTDLLLGLRAMRIFGEQPEAGASGGIALRAADDGSELDDPRFAGSDVLVSPVDGISGDGAAIDGAAAKERPEGP